jgi:hypothetical protein
LGSLTKIQTPLAIKTREKSITAIEEFDKFGLAGMCKRPAVATREEAVLLRELSHHVALRYPMKGNSSVSPSVIEKMIENVFSELPLTADLHHLTNRARFQEVDVPAQDLLVVIAKSNFPEMSAILHPRHEGQKPG